MSSRVNLVGRGGEEGEFMRKREREPSKMNAEKMIYLKINIYNIIYIGRKKGVLFKNLCCELKTKHRHTTHNKGIDAKYR